MKEENLFLVPQLLSYKDQGSGTAGSLFLEKIQAAVNMAR
jgi:hypothetical protein